MTITHKAIILLLAISSCSFLAYPQGIEKAVARADSLKETGDLPSAIFEYKRAVYFSGASPETSVYLKIADCFIGLQDHESADKYYSLALSTCHDDSLKTAIVFKTVLGDFETYNYYSALKKLQSLPVTQGSYQEREKMLFMGVSYWGLGDFDQAFKSFLQAVPENEISQRQKLLDLQHQFAKALKPAFPLLPVMSGIIPGSGQLLAGKFKEGIVSILLCGGIAAAGINSVFLFGDTAIMLFLGPWFLRYYLGGIDQVSQIIQQQRLEKRNLAFSLAMEQMEEMEHETLHLYDLFNTMAISRLSGSDEHKYDRGKLPDNLYTFYQKHISPQDIMDCIYYPTCSQYALETFRINGLPGILDAIDRLMRCHLLGQKNYPLLPGTNLYYDPPRESRRDERKRQNNISISIDM